MALLKPILAELRRDIVVFQCSDLMRHVSAKVERIAETVIPVPIRSESGTGKGRRTVLEPPPNSKGS